MYIAVVALTMFVLPVVSIAIHHTLVPAASLIPLVGRWFVFWGVGVRLVLAGVRQLLQPKFTAKEIFGSNSGDVLPLVRELGVANVSMAAVALLSLAIPTFILPAAISASIFYGVAGIGHLTTLHRSENQNIAMVSDLFLSAVLLLFIGALFFGY
jgi:hypothetical protein